MGKKPCLFKVSGRVRFRIIHDELEFCKCCRAMRKFSQRNADFKLTFSLMHKMTISPLFPDTADIKKTNAEVSYAYIGVDFKTPVFVMNFGH